MKIFVDDLSREVPEAATVYDVLTIFGEAVKHAVVEVNGLYVHPKEYGEKVLKTGDRMEVIYPAFGG
ncbi:MAG: sulfur carrier protein ThiS [Planctomycetota bacterium]|jgi:thiamine biosynthesis protein ThiS